MRTFLLTLLLAVFPALGAKTEILWDHYGVPHIFATDREAMFYAHGWAQAQNQGNLLLLLYGESRGRAAEYWGETHLALDRWVQLNGVPERAKSWYNAQDPVFRKYLDAFARGINDYAKAHPEAIASEQRKVLPVSGIDVVGHSLRAVHYMYMGSMERARREVTALMRSQEQARRILPEEPEVTAGSNTWAVGPSHSTSGKAMLLINPHLAWGNTFYRYMEVHLVGPGYDLYGAPQIGFPVPVVGFNRRTGWGRTVNTIDTVDLYRLTVKMGQYELDGKLQPFEHETKLLKVKQPDGSFREEKLEIRRSAQGPVVYDQNGIIVTMRVAGLDRPKMLEQWFRMGEAQNLAQFQDALRMMSVPMWNQNYADADGHILMVFDGLAPKRKTGDVSYWAGVVPGNTSQTLWNSYLSYEELPKSLDPAGGFHQNTNEPPWWMALPHLNPSNYPAYLSSPNMGATLFRTKRSLRMLMEDQKISYEKLLEDKLSTRMESADALLPDLLEQAKASAEPGIREAAQVLARWDRLTETTSKGAVLFKLFTDFYLIGNINDRLRVKFDGEHPVQSAYGIADGPHALAALGKAAEQCRQLYGSLDVPWGEVNRFASGNADMPGDGGPGKLGVFRTIDFGRDGREPLLCFTRGNVCMCD